ncbi:MAG: hypothetical protein R3357_09535 [Burkholderiales bacterium]|nr:hypothetical protein [Burkholderiales bacterium]
MTFPQRLALAILGRWMNIGDFPYVEILEVAAHSVRVRLHAPSSRHRLVSLDGDEEALRRAGVRPPDGWRIVDAGQSGSSAWLEYQPPKPLRVPRAGLDLCIAFENPTAPPAFLRVTMEVKRVVGGGGGFVRFPVGGLYALEVEAYNRKSALLREAQKRGVPWGSLPGADDLRDLQRRASELREPEAAAEPRDAAPSEP